MIPSARASASASASNDNCSVKSKTLRRSIYPFIDSPWGRGRNGDCQPVKNCNERSARAMIGAQ
jgi:hypothetical protein